MRVATRRPQSSTRICNSWLKATTFQRCWVRPVLLYRNDEPVRVVLEILTRNSRNSHELRLDIQAQYAGTYVGDRRIAELVAKYGADALREVMSQSLDHSEKLIRAEIAKIP